MVVQIEILGRIVLEVYPLFDEVVMLSVLD